MAAPNVPVIKVHAADATRHFQPRKARVNAMLNAGLQALAPDFHWGQLISTNDIVGLKVNARLGTLTGTRPTVCLLYTSPSPRDRQKSRMPSSA